MATAEETLRATLSENEFGALDILARSTEPLSGRKVAAVLRVSPTTANDALATLLSAGYATSGKAGRATLWSLTHENPTISAWLGETASASTTENHGSSPYSTGGGGVRLEHAYVATLVAAFLAGDAIGELGDSLVADTIRLQSSDTSPVDDIVLEGTDASGVAHRASIAVRRAPTLTASDTPSVPLIRDFLSVVTNHWSESSLGNWRLTLAVSSNANAITQLEELCTIAASMPNGVEFQERLSQAGRTSRPVRDRYDHLKNLVEQASATLASADGIDGVELTWRLLSSLSVRRLRLERTDRADRTQAVTTLQRLLIDGTPVAADALFSRLEELVGEWASQGAILTQAVVRRRLGDVGLTRSARFVTGWLVLDRLGARLRESVRPELRAGTTTLELERITERERLTDVVRLAGSSAGIVVVTGDPDLGKSALALRVGELLAAEGASITRLSLRDLPQRIADFESELGGHSVDDVLAASAVRPVRLMLIDGAEAVLENRAQLFRSIGAAALKAGIAVIAVTRSDGAKQVREELARASELAGITASPIEHVVAALSEDEIATLPVRFSALVRLNGDTKSRWLLGRLGLVDAILRTGRDFAPGELLCEADVYEAVWNSLVRRNESQPGGAASPDDRERAGLQVARRALGLQVNQASGTSLGELRSDGLLVAPRSLAISSGDQFASDLFRDFALCRLFTVAGWEPLSEVGAPRWTIRSARLAAQVALLGGTDRLEAWRRLTQEFDGLAETFGERWQEIPLEALLTLGDAESAIRELWGQLSSDDGKALTRLIGLADTRYVKGTIGDPFALAPIVQVVFCEGRAIPSGLRRGHRLGGEVVRELVLAWLRGAAIQMLQPNPLRQAVRDTILAGEPELYDEFAVEALASLGPDLDNRAASWLRQVATQRPSNLNRAVESAPVALSLSLANPKLLLELAEAYYIELPDPEDEWRGYGVADDGIRDFQHGLGIGAPGAAWYYGPFFRLLNTVPADAIAFINRMLDHAANFRVKKLHGYGDDSAHVDEPEGVELDLLGLGARHYVGDGHVWSWYRGSTVGPYACMSALLAMERFSDHLLEQVGLPARGIAEALLRTAHNLATPGLVCGFLTRHPEEAGDLLDSFLEYPEVWRLETGRVVSEHFSVRDPDADRLTGKERRSYTPHQTVAAMVIEARLRNDDRRLSKLAAVGAALLEKRRAETPNAGGTAESFAVVEGWAALFRFDNYSATATDDGVIIQFERPAEIEKVLAPGNRELQSIEAMYRLQNQYAIHNDTPQDWPTESLPEDLSVARQLDADDAIPAGFYEPENPLVAVAAAAVRAKALEASSFDPGDMGWAVQAIMWAATNPATDALGDYSGSMFVMGADRAAASSVPLLLLETFDGLVERDSVHESLQALGTSRIDEVRSILVTGCEPLWGAVCDIDATTGACSRHWPAWAAGMTGLAAARLGPWSSEEQRRLVDPLRPPFHLTLATIADDDILVNYLRTPLQMMVDARRVPCLVEQVEVLWTPLWDTYRRGLLHWWSKGYDHHTHRTHEPIAGRMVQVWVEGDRDILAAYIKSFAQDANALHLLFDGFATVFTYSDALRANLAEFWPWALGVALDALGDARELRREHLWFDYMVAALLPAPNARSGESDIDGVFLRARQNWLQPEAINGLAERWITLSRGEPKAVDAVIKFAKSSPPAWQVSVALTWIEQLIDGRFGQIANHLWYLEEWFTELRQSGLLTGSARTQYHRIVDGLAAAGDRAAVRLQQLDE
ncbi:hypothetical protein [Agromyces albus]|uniref:Uncharacterized protein n=1 Tax=Agromyces albus TaxID=205332 RepID=A0A4Q2KX97_9MICO|nr:hypothetical protein [Agromyces albus]RXZ70265.1 hypothetical protein ESP51_10235 [Agromyces albus]